MSTVAKSGWLKSLSGNSPFPKLGLMIASGLLGATAGIAINVNNSCKDFGSNESRIKTLKTYNIVVLAVAILFFAASFLPTVIFFATKV